MRIKTYNHYNQLIFNILLTFLLFAYANTITAQTLQKDMQILLSSLDILEKKTDSTPEFMVVGAAANVLAVLANYHQPLHRSDEVIAPENIIIAYQDNPLFSELINPELLYFPDSLHSKITAQVIERRQQLQSGERQEMLQILQANAAISPVDYLSIPATVEKYAVPPMTQAQALTQASEGVNRNVSQGFLTSQAAVIEGLFKFILNRAKDEVLVSYLDRLLNEDTPRFKKLFPTVVTEFGKQDFIYSESFVRRLRSAFYEDVQKISVRLPLLMLTDDYFQKLQSQPVVYNFLVIYSMLGLAQKDFPVDEIVPLTHRYLYDAYQESVKRVNVELVEKSTESEAYFQLIVQSEDLLKQIKELFLEFEEAEFAADDLIADFEENFPDATDFPLVSDYLDEEANNLKTILGQGVATPFTLNLLPQLIAGELDENYMKQYNTIADFDRFFSKNYTPKELRAAGLELVEKLNGTWYSEQSLSDLLYHWQEQLQRYRDDVDSWIIETDVEGSFAQDVAQVEQQRIDLQQTILDTKQFWWDSLGNQQRVAFAVLAEVINEAAFTTIESQNNIRAMVDSLNENVANLQDKKALIAQVESRLTTLDNQLYQSFETITTESPARQYLANKTGESSYAYLRPMIAKLEKQIRQLHTTKINLEKEFAPLYRRERNNAKPVLQTTELATYLMYNLRSNHKENNNKWLTISTLDSILNNEKEKTIFLGLMQEQLSSVKDLGTFSPTSLAQLTDATLREIPTLQRIELADSLDLKDSLAFYRKAAFTVNTLNRILEMPLIAKDKETGEIRPLKEYYPAMQNIPEVSEQALDVVYYLNVKNHGKAISSLIRLFSQLDTLEQNIVSVRQRDVNTVSDLTQVGNNATKTVKKANKKRKKEDKNITRYLRKYGDFIAGIIDARTTGEVEYLLETIADPPGSSRLKRTKSFTVGVNAYVAASVGQEFLTDKNSGVENDQFNFAPQMPIGISISGLLGRPLGFDGIPRRRASLSAFISFLDLGSLFTYSAPINGLGESDFTFKNIFKLGAQLHWNINRSPFFLGAGAQYGPQFREINTKSQAVESVRYFINFGVDVPIKTLYQR